MNFRCIFSKYYFTNFWALGNTGKKIIIIILLLQVGNKQATVIDILWKQYHEKLMFQNA